MLESVLPAKLFVFLLILVRVGAAAMVMPGIGDSYVTRRARVIFAFFMALILAPLLADKLPGRPGEPIALALVLIGEVFIGLLLGGVARMIVGALMIAGMIMAFMSTLSNALVNDPTAQQQGSIVGAFLSTMGVLLIFATDTHHMMLRAMVDSYAVFPAGRAPPMQDIAQFVARTAADAFKLGFQLAMPFLVVGTIFYIGVGLINRLMPQVQIFFVAIPLQVGKGIVLLLVTLPAIMQWFLQSFTESYRPLLNL
ncbi:flagellar biosynthetic protein FliR [Limimonas halophila]|uniref:Flagellar biosynthetic protein FliR n=1 Tax=Limimonas halophila TaxID=1082479 RepID=A0A1G7Q954_9PROT|nr:flagellar biosynthetic protein FliR [Limimonas halophila]SDF94479.1 flagellar biosynthetic protein FliR [Limimonas halophila]